MERVRENGEQFKAKREAFGLTGVVGRDGILTPERYQLLDQIQTQAADAVMAHLGEMKPGDKYPLVAMATGIGKGKIIHEVIKRQRAKKANSKTLVLAGTKVVLVDQMSQALSTYVQGEDIITQTNGYVESEDIEEEQSVEGSILDPDRDIDESEIEEGEFSGYITGKYGDKNADVQITTLQRVKSESNRGKLNTLETDLLVVDEVHNAGTQKVKDVVTQFPRVVGFTATPYRYSGKIRAPEEYGFKVVSSYSLPEAQEARLLPPLYALQLNTSELVDEIPTTLTGKIDFKEMERILKESPELRPYIVDKIVPIITLNGNHYKTVVAVNFVWEAVEIANLLKDKGIKVGVAVNQQAAKSIHSEGIPALDAIERYKLPGEDPESIQVLISPYVTGEGFDAPATEILVWASPTDSHLRYTQYTGRLARRCNGKAYGVVIDCLYQTSQFRWTYNFAMWMKGNIGQLDNGLIYLGPLQTKDLICLQNMLNLSDTFNLEVLQRESLFDIQATDFSLSVKSYESIFVQKKNLRDIAKSVIGKLKERYPKLFVLRMNNPKIVEVCLDREIFIQAMLEAGARLKPQLDPVQTTDFALVARSFNQFFQGNYERGDNHKDIINSVVNKLKKEHPELFVLRSSGSHTIEVCTNKDLLIQTISEAGVKLKLEDTIQDTDLEITPAALKDIFEGNIGKYGQLKEMITKVKNKIRGEHPELFALRKNGPTTVEVCTKKDIFIQAMLEVGAKFRTKEVYLQTDFILSRDGFQLFEGNYTTGSKLKETAEAVIDELKRVQPELFIFRKNGKHTIEVCTDRNLFIQAMLEAGAKLKLSLESVQLTDFAITPLAFHEVFVEYYTSKSSFKGTADAVINRLRKEYPELFTNRKSGKHTIEVCTDRNLFIQAMLEAGAKLNSSN